MPGFEQAFLQDFDHKNVPAVLGINPGFAKRKVNSSAVLWPHRGHGHKWLVHNIRIVQSHTVYGRIRVSTMERHNWHLMLNIYKHTTYYNMYCSHFFIRSILNIMCDSLNTLCCSFLITRSGFVIMRCRSYKWCSSLIITCCAFIYCRATCYFMYSRYNIIRSIPLIIRCSKFITCCGYIFQ